jgi:phosphoribosylamine--glycine ligase
MKILVIGSGAREHAILRALARETGGATGVVHETHRSGGARDDVGARVTGQGLQDTQSAQITRVSTTQQSAQQQDAQVAFVNQPPCCQTHRLFVVGGNPGIWELAQEVEGTKSTDHVGIVQFVERESIDLVIVGPEAPLADGLVDVLHEAVPRLAVFGPSQAAAQLESSKSFAKEIMDAADVPTARAYTCETIAQVEEGFARLAATDGARGADLAAGAGGTAGARGAGGGNLAGSEGDGCVGEAGTGAVSSGLDTPCPPQPQNYVVKADGLASGKGVVVTQDYQEALAHARKCLGVGDGEASPAGGVSGAGAGAGGAATAGAPSAGTTQNLAAKVVIEEYLDGPEFSQFFICDGKVALPLLPAQDFKRIFDGDQGGNTGGMGSYAPLDWLPAGTSEWCRQFVAQPVVDEMNRRGTPFVGVLFAGLAYTSRGVRVIEFNVRFGDPETQVVLESLRTPLSQLLYDAARGALNPDQQIKWSDEYYCNVVLASAGYPESSHNGDLITGIPSVEARGGVVLHAGTAYTGSDTGAIVTNGGRVLSVLAHAKDLKTARERAYNYAQAITFSGKQNRTDIALAAVNGDIRI